MKTSLQIALGAAVGLAASLAALALLSSDEPAAAQAAVGVPENAGALTRVVMHYTARDADWTETTYRQILTGLDPAVEVVVAVESAADFDDLTARLQAAGVTRPLSPLVVGERISTWSRDRYTLLSAPTANEPWVLAVPESSDGLTQARLNDWMVPFAIGDTRSDVEVLRLPLRFDGGDLMVTERHVIASHRMIEKNVGSLVQTREELIQVLAAGIGKPVVIIGETAEEVPWHHMGMYLNPLPDGRIAVGDPDLALSLLGEARALELGADLSPAMLDRFRNVARMLREQGFNVELLPLLPLDAMSYINYNNGLLDVRPEGATVLLPSYGIPELDNDAAARYAAWGIRVVPIDVTQVYPQRGTVHCLVNVLARAGLPQTAAVASTVPAP